MDTFTTACTTNIPLMIISYLLCIWAEDQTEAIDAETLIDHVAEHVYSFSPGSATIQ
jgi:hypothetical protein